MPLYLYENLETGAREERMVPIAERDSVPGLRRVFDPPKLVILGQAENPFDPDLQLRRGLKKMEDHDRRSLEKQAQFSTDEMKQIWAN